MKKYIPLTECIDGGLYRIEGRNFGIGVFDAKTSGFVGIREKFGHEYLDEEFHFDTGAPFGTVFVEEYLEACPISTAAMNNQPLFDYLKEKRIQYRQKDD